LILKSALVKKVEYCNTILAQGLAVSHSNRRRKPFIFMNNNIMECNVDDEIEEKDGDVGGKDGNKVAGGGGGMPPPHCPPCSCLSKTWNLGAACCWSLPSRAPIAHLAYADAKFITAGILLLSSQSMTPSQTWTQKLCLSMKCIFIKVNTST
jgi:hypothetical protein